MDLLQACNFNATTYYLNGKTGYLEPITYGSAGVSGLAALEERVTTLESN